jgi:hypothetical protein
MSAVPAAGRDALRARLEQICRGPQAAPGAARALATGHAALDALLPGGGWPLGAVTELYAQAQGIGELTLLLPALAHLTRAGRHVACIAPPHLPYPPALASHGLVLAHFLHVQARAPRESLWATEQALRCPAVGAVLAWPSGLDDRAVRRLQLAAEAGGGCALLYRPLAELARPSPAALRLQLRPSGPGDDEAGLHLELFKVRGGHRRALVVHPAAAAAA